MPHIPLPTTQQKNKKMNITNDIITQYIHSFYKPIDEKFRQLRETSERAGVPIILKETENFLTFFLGLTKPKNVLEIGTAVGYSAMVFANFGANVITIEKNENMAQAAINNIESMGFDSQIKVLIGDGREALENLNDKPNSFDLVFIDAAKSHYKAFLEGALPYCHQGTIIVSDNVLLKGSTASEEFDTKGRFRTNIKKMRLYLEYISNHPKLDTTIITSGDGLALSRCI